jgi:hypothetical protein
MTGRIESRGREINWGWLCNSLFFGINVAQRHDRFLSRRFLHCYSQGDGVNKAPSVACGNFAIDTTCGYLTVPERPTEVRKLETPNFGQWRICKWVANEG